jgi:hypothetical protein
MRENSSFAGRVRPRRMRNLLIGGQVAASPSSGRSTFEVLNAPANSTSIRIRPYNAAWEGAKAPEFQSLLQDDRGRIWVFTGPFQRRQVFCRKWHT